MNNGKINSKIKLSNIFRYFNIRNFEIPKYWSFYISSFQILTPTPFEELEMYNKKGIGRNL